MSCFQIELQNMIETQHVIDDRPSVTRYPRGNGYGEELLNDIYGLTGNNSVYVHGEMPAKGRPLAIGKGRVVKEHSRVGSPPSRHFSYVHLHSSCLFSSRSLMRL